MRSAEGLATMTRRLGFMIFVLPTCLGCATGPRVSTMHPASADAPSAPVLRVARSLHDDPVPLDVDGASSPHAGHVMPVGETMPADSPTAATTSMRSGHSGHTMPVNVPAP